MSKWKATASWARSVQAEAQKSWEEDQAQAMNEFMDCVEQEIEGAAEDRRSSVVLDLFEHEDVSVSRDFASRLATELRAGGFTVVEREHEEVPHRPLLEVKW